MTAYPSYVGLAIRIILVALIVVPFVRFEQPPCCQPKTACCGDDHSAPCCDYDIVVELNGAWKDGLLPPPHDVPAPDLALIWADTPSWEAVAVWEVPPLPACPGAPRAPPHLRTTVLRL